MEVSVRIIFRPPYAEISEKKFKLVLKCPEINKLVLDILK